MLSTLLALIELVIHRFVNGLDLCCLELRPESGLVALHDPNQLLILFALHHDRLGFVGVCDFYDLSFHLFLFFFAEKVLLDVDCPFPCVPSLNVWD